MLVEVCFFVSPVYGIRKPSSLGPIVSSFTGSNGCRMQPGKRISTSDAARNFSTSATPVRPAEQRMHAAERQHEADEGPDAIRAGRASPATFQWASRICRATASLSSN